MAFLPHEIRDPDPTAEQLEYVRTLLRSRIADAILRSRNNQLTPEQQAAVIEAERQVLGFDAIAKARADRI